MHVFVDESGSFVSASVPNAWNSIAAYVLPESDRTGMLDELARLKRRVRVPRNDEVKLRDLTEADYFGFLHGLGDLNGVLFAVLIDMASNDVATVEDHRSRQATKIVEHVDKMVYESGRNAVERLGDQVLKLPAQLYVQLQCQLMLFDTLLRSSLLYFVQRRP